MNLTTNDISRALQSIEATERDDQHPRTIARRKVREFRSDAEQRQLPTTNVHDDKGAPVLNRDEVLRRSYPDHARSKR